jgi:hypothetical protein
MKLELIDKTTLRINDVLTINVDADLDRQKWEDIIGFHEVTFPAELIRDWILENQTFKLPYHEDYETGFNPMLDEDYTCDRPDFAICMYHQAMFSKKKYTINVYCTHIMWVIHDLYHADNHCHAEEVYVKDYHEYETHRYTFAMLAELDLLEYTWEEMQLFEKIVLAQNEVTVNRYTRSDEYLLSLGKLLPGYEEKMYVDEYDESQLELEFDILE